MESSHFACKKRQKRRERQKEAQEEAALEEGVADVLEAELNEMKEELGELGEQQADDWEDDDDDDDSEDGEDDEELQCLLHALNPQCLLLHSCRWSEAAASENCRAAFPTSALDVVPRTAMSTAARARLAAIVNWRWSYDS